MQRVVCCRQQVAGQAANFLNVILPSSMVLAEYLKVVSALL